MHRIDYRNQISKTSFQNFLWKLFQKSSENCSCSFWVNIFLSAVVGMLPGVALRCFLEAFQGRILWGFVQEFLTVGILSKVPSIIITRNLSSESLLEFFKKFFHDFLQKFLCVFQILITFIKSVKRSFWGFF